MENYLSYDMKIMYYNSFIVSRMDYCICIWGGASVKLINKLYKIQKRAARIILCDHFETSSKELFQRLKWMNIFQRMEYIRCLMMYKIYNKFVPEYIYKDFSIKKQCTNYCLRSNGTSSQFYKVQKTQMNMVKQSFLISGPKLWNNLPEPIKQANSSKNFKQLYFKSTVF